MGWQNKQIKCMESGCSNHIRHLHQACGSIILLTRKDHLSCLCQLLLLSKDNHLHWCHLQIQMKIKLKHVWKKPHDKKHNKAVSFLITFPCNDFIKLVDEWKNSVQYLPPSLHSFSIFLKTPWFTIWYPTPTSATSHQSVFSFTHFIFSWYRLQNTIIGMLNVIDFLTVILQ